MAQNSSNTQLTFQTRPPEVCRNCHEEGHHKSGNNFYSTDSLTCADHIIDCTNEKVFKCNNCEELGHRANECKAPKDWSRHKCRRESPSTTSNIDKLTDLLTDCGEFGHGSENRCDPERKAAFQAAKAEAEGGAGGDFNAGGDGFDSGANGFDSGANGFESTDSFAAGGASSWETTEIATPKAGGGW